LGSIGFISHLLRKAPEGWEDSSGFHFRDEARVEARSTALAPSSSLFHREVVHAAPAAVR
ncbi:MAG: hypothetical protein ACJ8I9_03325, partial [Chthoniobacterales bacterium]